MIHLQCTHAVLKYFGMVPRDTAHAENTGALLGNWSATNFLVDRRRVFLFMSDKTLLSFVLTEGEKKFDLARLQPLLENGLAQLLTFMKVPPQSVEAAVADLDVISLTKTKDRALVGNLNALANDYSQHIWQQGGLRSCNLTAIILGVNDGPQRRLGWSSAARITHELLAAERSALAVRALQVLPKT